MTSVALAQPDDMPPPQVVSELSKVPRLQSFLFIRPPPARSDEGDGDNSDDSASSEGSAVDVEEAACALMGVQAQTAQHQEFYKEGAHRMDPFDSIDNAYHNMKRGGGGDSYNKGPMYTGGKQYHGYNEAVDRGVDPNTSYGGARGAPMFGG